MRSNLTDSLTKRLAPPPPSPTPDSPLRMYAPPPPGDYAIGLKPDLSTSVPISTFCGILILALGVLNFIYVKLLRQHLTQGKLAYFCDFVLLNLVLWSCFWLTESKVSFIFAYHFCI